MINEYIALNFTVTAQKFSYFVLRLIMIKSTQIAFLRSLTGTQNEIEDWNIDMEPCS